jgi:hypothetical protein
MPKFDAFISAGYSAAITPNASAAQCLNLYPDLDSSGGKGPGALVGTPGLQLFMTLPTSPIRALWAGNQRMFAVAGNTLYEVFSDGTYNVRGTVGNDGKPAYIVSNRNQLGVVSAGQFYCDTGTALVTATYSPSFAGTVFTRAASDPFQPKEVVWVSGDQFPSGLTNIVINSVGYVVAQVVDSTHLYVTADPGYQTNVAYTASSNVFASSLGFIDGYFVVSQPQSQEFSISNGLPGIPDGTVWSALDEAAKEAYPDNISAVFTDHEELYLFGDEQSTEVWQDTGNANFPFQRIPGYIMHYGCAAQYSVARLTNGVAWLAIDEVRGSCVAIHAIGFSPNIVSTPAVEYAWSQYPTIADAVSFSYIEEGHHFWIITFPSGNATWGYDASTGLWHQRGWFNGTTNDRQRQMFHAYVGLVAHGSAAVLNPVHFVGDWQNGNIYIQRLNVYQDNGTAIQVIRACPYLSNEGKRMFGMRAQLEADVSTGSTPSGLTINPLMDWSDDGGHTFSNTHSPRATDQGTAGRLVYPRLGASKFSGRVLRITDSSNAKRRFVQLDVEYTPGTK